MAIPCPGSAAAAGSAEKNCKAQQHAPAPARGCRVAGCNLELSPGYSAKYRICLVHYKTSSLEVDGKEQRFCQQCGRFHEVQAFEGERRSCKESLARHKQRRKKAEALRAQNQERERRQAAVGSGRAQEALPEERQPEDKDQSGKQEGGQPACNKAGSLDSKAAPPASQQATEVSATGVSLRRQARQGGSPKKRSAQPARAPAQKRVRAESPKAEEEATIVRATAGVSSGGSSRATSEAPSVHPPGPALSGPSKPPTPAHSSPCAAKSPVRREPGNRGSLLQAESAPPAGVALPAPQVAVPGPVFAAPRPQPHLVQEALKTIGSSAAMDDVPSTEELLTFSQELGLLLDPALPATAHAASHTPTWPLPACSAAPPAAWAAPAHTAAAGGWGSAPAACLAPAQGRFPGAPLPTLQLPAWQTPSLAGSLAPLQRWSGEPAALAPPPGLQCGVMDASSAPPLPLDWPCGDDDWLLPLDPLSPSASLAETFLP